VHIPPAPPPGDAPPAFARDRLTLLAYALAALFGFTIASLGPAMPLLRDDLGISRTVGGLHFTVVALGAVSFGFVVDRMARRWGRWRLFWAGGAGVATGALLIGSASHPALSLTGAALIGGPGTAMLATIQATLSDRHASRRPVALTEANTATSVGTVLPALLIGALVAAGAGWRPALLLPLAAWIVVFAAGRREPFSPPNPAPQPGERRGLPAPYWFFWAALIPSVGAEWSVGAWGAGYLVDVANTSEGAASFLMTAFFGAMVIGRVIGGRLARRVEPFPLVLGAAGVGLGGILALWAATEALPIVVGLFVTGLGIAMLFPMLLSLALGVAADRSDAATARVSIAAGSSVVVAPLTLGAIADQAGIRTAFGIVPGLFAGVVLAAVLGRRAAARSAHPSG
jgi:MFS family permease